MGLVDQYGRPISSSDFRKGDPPKLGEAFGNWAGRDLQHMQLPGGGIVQFDLNKLQLADYRNMRDHPQVNASLSVLSFMLHQSDWHIESKDKKIAEHCEENLKEAWTQVNRGLSMSNWAGYSPNVLQWENDTNGRTVQLTKVKDLVPEECGINWRDEEGWAPPGHIKPKFKVYDGIKQIGARWPIPVENSLWYPILMESGDHYGKKLLRPAFQSWFFSILLHLFANRYYERFGEPVPVGRAPFDEDIEIGGSTVKGNTYMLSILAQLRNRSVVVLPNDKTDMGDGKREYDYDIEYLESQMRGADFERYMTRLDEEISLGIFTPILLMRTADVGSYNLGVGHMQLWLWMLNALNDDRAQYINKYILRRMVDYNFSKNAPDAKIVFRKMGSKNEETIRAVVTELVQSGRAKPDIVELGQMAGMTLTEIKQTTKPVEAPAVDPNADPNADPSTDPGGKVVPIAKGKDTREARIRDKKKTARVVANSVALNDTMTEIYSRVRPQIVNAYRDNRWSELQVTLGFKKKFAASFIEGGAEFADEFYSHMDTWLQDVLPAAEAFGGADRFMELFTAVAITKLQEGGSGDDEG